MPAHLFDLTALRTLNLMGNQLERLPEALGNLRHLRLLGLKSNKVRRRDRTTGLPWRWTPLLCVPLWGAALRFLLKGSGLTHV